MHLFEQIAAGLLKFDVQFFKLMIWPSLFANRLFCARSFCTADQARRRDQSRLCNLLESAAVD